MSRLADTALVGGERVDATDHCLAGIARLSSEVKDASSYLPAYDQRTYAEAIKALQEKLADTRAAFAPRQQFKFKTARKNPSAVSLNDAAELATQRRRHVPGYLSPDSSSIDSSISTTPAYLRTPPNETTAGPDLRLVPSNPPPAVVDPASRSIEEPQSSKKDDGPNAGSVDDESLYLSTSTTNVSISNQTSAHIILPTSHTHASTPCALTKMERCVIDMSVPTINGAPFASLTIRNIQSSLLLCGIVSGPAHITNVRGSVLVVNCRQFRMHECRDVDVYLTCSSRPIIEDCNGIRFAKIPLTYQNVTHQKSPETSSPDQWDQVDDFKWLKAEHSPNWSLLPPDDIVVDDIWREIVPGGPGWTLEDILKATKVMK